METQALKDFKLKQELRKKYGVTFHKHMDAKTVVKQYGLAVANNPQVQSLVPGLAELMIGISVALELKDTAIKTAIVVKKTYDTAKDSLESASAVLTGQVQVPSAKIAFIGGNVGQIASTTAVNIATKTLLSSL